MTVLAQNNTIETTIKAIDVTRLTITLADGKTYQVPAEFNFNGLTVGEKVSVSYSLVDGKRVIDDLDVED
ncbi:DUF1344 domain-containing protein [Allorhizobium sonneratiae]|uniref:DUF1344 domain-containing protein n=1 Tax=Allorhizobium sonneratiae TaxID=2934936 RepID=UPI003B8454D1